MRFVLSALALLLSLSAASAKADTYEISVTNFDGFGSSATFNVNSVYQVTRIPSGSPPQIEAGSPIVNFTYQTGATVPFAVYTGTVGDGPGLAVTQGPVYFSDHLELGFGGQFGFVIAPRVGVDMRNFLVPMDIDLASSAVIYTIDGYTATVHTGTYGNVTVVNVTPEPSSLVLLGTGFLGTFGLLRRKNGTRSAS